MKKFLAIVAIAAVLVSCDDAKKAEGAVEGADTNKVVTPDTNKVVTPDTTKGGVTGVINDAKGAVTEGVNKAVETGKEGVKAVTDKAVETGKEGVKAVTDKMVPTPEVKK